MAFESHFNINNLDWSGDFDMQVKHVMEAVRLTRTEVSNLTNVIIDLQNALERVWHGCQVMVFGSLVTGLGIRSSDVDCFVYVPDHYEYNQAKFVILARNILRKQPWIFKKLFAITTAKVPILKLFHAPTCRSCDVSFKSPAGVRNSRLIAYLLHMDERALPLAILIKFWSKVHKLTGTNLVPNYALSMIIIFYLQQKNILPPVDHVQKTANGSFYVDHWDTAFNENYCHNTDNTESLYELLGGFFKFYSNFKFDEFIISPFVGNSIPKRLFGTTKEVPNAFLVYKRLVNDGFEALKTDHPMCVQEVFEHNRNCTASVFPRLATRLILHIKLAAKICGEVSSEDFLKEIMERKPDMPKPVKLVRPDMPAKKNEVTLIPITKEPPMEKPTNLKRPMENLTSLFMQGRKAKKAKKKKM